MKYWLQVHNANTFTKILEILEVIILQLLGLIFYSANLYNCQFSVSATFVCPMQLLTNSGDLRLLVSAYLENKELWAREIPITPNCFSATYIGKLCAAFVR